MPDRLFNLAEAAARKLRVSRSELYAKAIAEYLERRQSSAITERLNAALRVGRPQTLTCRNGDRSINLYILTSRS